jgi:hypothetical protein
MVADLVNGLIDSGFRIERLLEPAPVDETFGDSPIVNGGKTSPCSIINSDTRSLTVVVRYVGRLGGRPRSANSSPLFLFC